MSVDRLRPAYVDGAFTTPANRPADGRRTMRSTVNLLRRDVIVCNICDIIIVRNICKHGKWPTWFNTPNLLHNVAGTDVAAAVRRYIRRRRIKGCWGKLGL